MRPTKDSLIILGVLGALVLGTLLFVYVPQGKTLNDLEAQIVTKRRDLASESKQGAIIPKLLR